MVPLGTISVKSVTALEAGKTLWDSGHKQAVKGFGVRRQKNDPVYVVKFRILGRQRFLTIGRHGAPWTPETARREAKRLLGAVASGKDPQRQKQEARQNSAETVHKVVQRYLEFAHAKQKPRSFEETKRHLLTNWRSLHSTPLIEVTRRHIAIQLNELGAKHGPVTAARARAAFSAMFNWAIREGMEITSNPVAGTNRPVEPKSRERVLTDPELREIWNSCGNDDYGRIVRLLMLTAQRRDEVGGIRMAEIDVPAAVWTLPSTRTKNRREHVVPLLPKAQEVLNVLHPTKIDHLFGSGPRQSGGVRRGFSGWSKAKKELDQRIRAARSPEDDCLLIDWRLHDLRRTSATVMADKLGVAPYVIEALLNHVSGYKAGIAGVYNRATYIADTRNALQKWESYLMKVVIAPTL